MRPSLYRVIATAPYGLWETDVREFLVNEKPVQFTIVVRPKPTAGYGDVVTVGTKKQALKVLRSDGQPAASAEVYVRDREATLNLERRYKTNAQGQAEIELVAEPTVVAITFGDSQVMREIHGTEGELVVQLPQTPD